MGKDSKSQKEPVYAWYYVKLQQAYISEAVAIGNWQIIGYKGPGNQGTGASSSGGATSGTTNFNYKDADGYTNNTVALSESTVGWTASNVAQLNDCTAGDNWTVTVTAASAGSAGEASFTATVDGSCTDLTPNFDKIGK